MMDDAPVARLHFDGLHPFVFGEIRFDDDVLIGHYAGRLDRHRLGELKDGIRLADQPALIKLEWLGSVAAIPSRLASGDPVEQVFSQNQPGNGHSPRECGPPVIWRPVSARPRTTAA